MLHIRLLGQPETRLNGLPLHLPRRKSRALLYYLAAQAHPVARSELLALLWPDQPRPAGLQVLRTTLHGIRQALGAHLLSDAEQVQLDSETEIDARKFAAYLEKPPLPSQVGELAGVLALYQGQFLAGFELGDAGSDFSSSGFDDWLTIEREHYRRMFITGLSLLSQLHAEQGAYSQALQAVDRALAVDPLQEDLQREGIRLAFLGGDRPASIRRYDQLRRILDEELGMPPMAETRQLYDAIINDRPVPGGSPAAQPTQTSRAPLTPPGSGSKSPKNRWQELPFTGRVNELQALRQITAAGSLALIEGEPGIGKTRLAVEYLRSAHALELKGAARELEHAIPYQPIIEALRGLASRPEWTKLAPALRQELQTVWWNEIGRLLPEIAPAQDSIMAAAPAQESRLWEGMLQFLLALEHRQPVAVFIDDLQWADAATLGMLGYLVRQATGSRLVFLAATRPVQPRTPLAALLQALTREARVMRIPLARLEPGDIQEMVERLCTTHNKGVLDSQPYKTFITWLGKSSEGNPYILAEQVRHARESGLISDNGSLNPDKAGRLMKQMDSSPVVPQSIYTLIQARLERLSDPARRLLDTAVAAGREFEFEITTRAAALDEDRALDALDELLSSGLVLPLANQEEPTSHRYSFDHSLTMEVAYQEVGEPRHRQLHRRLAEALAALGRQQANPGLIAWHFREGGDLERAAPYALEAGKHAAALAAWHEAIAFYQQALEGESDPAKRLTLTMLISQAHFQAGENAQAAESFRSVLAMASPGSQEEEAARLALAQSLLPQARFDEAIALAGELHSSSRREVALQAEFVWGTALSLKGADLAEAAAHLQQAERLSTELDNPLYISLVEFELGSVAAQQGDLPSAVERYRVALSAAQQAVQIPALAADARQRLVLAYNNLAYHLHLLDDPSAPDHAKQGLELASEHGLLGIQPYLLSTLGEIELAAGHLELAGALFNEGLAIAQRLNIPERIAGLTANLGRLAKQRGQAALAIQQLTAALAQADSLGTLHLAAQVRLWLAPLLPPADARQRLAEARAIAENSGRRRLLEEVERLHKEIQN